MINKKIIQGSLCRRKLKSFNQGADEKREDVFNTFTEESKNFSASSIKDRLKLASQPPRNRMRLTYRDWKKFYDSNKDKLKSDKMDIAEKLFVEDLMGIMNAVVPEIKKGKKMSQLLGLTNISKNSSKVADKMSPVYKKALLLEERLGSIPKAIYEDLTELYTQFVNSMLNDVFEQNNDVPLLQRLKK